MASLTNRFTLFGELSEAAISLYPTHIKIKMAVKIDYYVVTTYGIIQRKFNAEEYRRFSALLYRLRSAADGVVYVGDEEHYRFPNINPTRVFVSGNLSPSNDSIFFNQEYCDIVESSEDSLSIELAGQWTDDNRFMNVLSDSPRLFSFERPPECKDGIYKFMLGYDPGYKLLDGVIHSYDAPRLHPECWKETSKYISDKKMQELLMEWDILHDR